MYTQRDPSLPSKNTSKIVRRSANAALGLIMLSSPIVTACEAPSNTTSESVTNTERATINDVARHNGKIILKAYGALAKSAKMIADGATTRIPSKIAGTYSGLLPDGTGDMSASITESSQTSQRDNLYNASSNILITKNTVGTMTVLELNAQWNDFVTDKNGKLVGANGDPLQKGTQDLGYDLIFSVPTKPSYAESISSTQVAAIIDDPSASATKIELTNIGYGGYGYVDIFDIEKTSFSRSDGTKQRPDQPTMTAQLEADIASPNIVLSKFDN